MIGTGHSHTAMIMRHKGVTDADLFVWGSNTKMQMTKNFVSAAGFSKDPYKVELSHDGSMYQPKYVSCGPYNTFVVAEKKWVKQNPAEGVEAFANLQKNMSGGESLMEILTKQGKYNKLGVVGDTVAISSTAFSSVLDNFGDQRDINIIRDYLFTGSKDNISVKELEEYLRNQHHSFGLLFTFGYSENQVINQEFKELLAQRVEEEKLLEKQDPDQQGGGLERQPANLIFDVFSATFAHNQQQSVLTAIEQQDSLRSQRPKQNEEQFGQEFSRGKVVETPAAILMPKGAGPVWKVACGLHHVLILTKKGNIFALGNGENYGEVGTGRRVYLETPHILEVIEEISGELEKFTEISCGKYHNMAISDKHNLWTWGCGANGRLGNLSYDDQYFPIQLKHLSRLKPIKAVCGDSHSACIIAKEKLYTWGCGGYGRLGHGDDRDHDFPEMVAQLSGQDVVHVSCGAFHSLATTRTGKLYSFGLVREGRLGIPNTDSVRTNYVPTPVRVRLADEDIDENVQFLYTAAGFRHSLAVYSQKLNNLYTDIVASWGFRGFGILGRDATDPDIPGTLAEVELKHPVIQPFIKLQGHRGTKPRGGKRAHDQEGDEKIIKVVQITTSEYNTVVRNEAGEIYVIGDGHFGQRAIEPAQLYQGNRKNKAAKDADPLRAPLKIEPFGSLPKNRATNIATGDGHILVVTTNGEVFSWGRNDLGQLGCGSAVDYISSPEPIALYQASQVFAKEDYSAVVSVFGELFTFGSNQYGKLGLNFEREEPVISPTKVLLNGSVERMALGVSHAIAIMRPRPMKNYSEEESKQSDATVYTWGRGTYGQLGNAGLKGSPKPVSLASNLLIKKASCGLNFSVAIDDQGELFFWGQARYFPLKRKDKVKEIILPRLITTPYDKSLDVAAGEHRVFVLTDKYEIYDWGEAPSDKKTQDEFFLRKTNSEDIKENPLFEKVVAGPSHCVLLSSTHEVFAWGENRHCRLGFPRQKKTDETPIYTRYPALVTSLKNTLHSRIKTKPRGGINPIARQRNAPSQQRALPAQANIAQPDASTSMIKNPEDRGSRTEGRTKNRGIQEQFESAAIVADIQIDTGPLIEHARQLSKQLLLEESQEDKLMENDERNVELYERICTMFDKVKEKTEAHKRHLLGIESAFISRIQQAPFRLHGQPVSEIPAPPWTQGKRGQALQKVVAFLQLHPCYITNIYKVKPQDTTFLMDLVKGLFIGIEGSKRLRVLLVCLAQRVFLADLEAKADLFNERSFFWQLFDFLIESSEQNLKYFAIIIGYLINTISKDRGRDEAKDCLAVSGKKIEELQRQFVADNAFTNQMNNRANFLAEKVREIADSISKGKLITLDSFDCDDGFGIGKLPSYTEKAKDELRQNQGGKYLDDQEFHFMLGNFGSKMLAIAARQLRESIARRLLRFSKEIVTLISFLKTNLENQDLPSQKLLPLVFRRLRYAHKDPKFYLSRLFTKENLNEKVKQHRENIRSFGEAFIAFVGGTDLVLKDTKGSWLNDYNRNMKNKQKELRTKLIRHFNEPQNKAFKSLQLTNLAQQVKHSSSSDQGSEAIFKVTTLERLRAVLTSQLSKIVFQGSKAGDLFYYACKDFLKSGGVQQEAVKSARLDEEDKEQSEPRQRVVVRIQSQVLLQNQDKGWCEYCGATLPLKQLSTAGQPFVLRYDPVEKYTKVAKFEKILKRATLKGILNLYHLLASEAKVCRDTKDFQRLALVEEFGMQVGINLRDQRLARKPDADRREALVLNDILEELDLLLETRAMHHDETNLALEKFLKMEKYLKGAINKLDMDQWTDRVIRNIQFGVADKNLLKLSKSVMSLGTTKKIQASIEKRPMSGTLFQHLNYEEKKALKAYSSRSLVSLIRKGVIHQIKLKPFVHSSCSVIIQEVDDNAFQLSVIMKKKMSKGICAPSTNSGFGSSSTEILFKKLLEQETLLQLKREVHLNAEKWGYVSQSGKRIKKKKAPKAGENEEETQDKKESDKILSLDKFLFLDKYRFNELMLTLESAKLAYVQNTANPEDIGKKNTEE